MSNFDNSKHSDFDILRTQGRIKSTESTTERSFRSTVTATRPDVEVSNMLLQGLQGRLLAVSCMCRTCLRHGLVPLLPLKRPLVAPVVSQRFVDGLEEAQDRALPNLGEYE